jgi:hypothetical protein
MARSTMPEQVTCRANASEFVLIADCVERKGCRK